MKKLAVNPRLARCFGALKPEQIKRLEMELAEDPTTEPIVWWHNPDNGQDEILDGHHRYEIAERLNMALQVHEKHFDTEDEAYYWILRNQTTKRSIDNFQRADALRECVAMEIRRGSSTTQAVAQAAAITGASERTVYRAMAEDAQARSAQEQYREAKAKFEVQTTKSQVKQAEELKQRARREGWAEDTDRLEDEWQQMNQDALIDETEAKTELERLAENAAQERAENPHSRGGKRKTKKSVLAASNRRNALKKATSAIEKVNSPLKEIDVFIPELKTGDMRKALETFLEQIQALQVADAKKAKKKRFGR